MGVVYRAFDTKLKRVVAVKLLSEPGAAHRERFEREVHALSRLAHPNLVQLLDAELGSRSYLVMELVEGTTLAAQLANGPLSPEQTAGLGAGTASALAYVHAQGIVHRDVKPANVLVDGQGKPYLADFGIARLLGTARMTATGLALGTPAYLAPEQLLGNEIGPGGRRVRPGPGPDRVLEWPPCFRWDRSRGTCCPPPSRPHGPGRRRAQTGVTSWPP